MNCGQKRKPCPPINYVGVIGTTGPTGPTGPTGATGPAITSVYGSKYNTSADTITLTQDVLSNVNLGTSGPNAGITNTNTNTLTINEDGIYQISYFFQGASSATGELTIELTRNTNPITSTSIIKDVTANKDESFNGSTIISLSAGDEIGLGISSSVAATITPASGTNAYLNITKIA